MERAPPHIVVVVMVVAAVAVVVVGGVRRRIVSKQYKRKEEMIEMVTVEDAIEHFFAGLKARLENRTQHAFVAFINTSTRKPPHTLVQTHSRIFGA